MRTLICLYKLTPEQEEQIRQAAPGWEIRFRNDTEHFSAEELAEAEVLAGWRTSARAALEAGSKLKWVQGWSAGIDTLPLQALEARGVLLTDASGIHPNAMSETALSLMLALTRQLHDAVRKQQQELWEPAAGNRYGEMHGCTAAIIGAGTIGTELGRLCQAFGMRTLGIRRSGKPADFIDQMYTMNRLDEVLVQADYVINILPLTTETRGVFNASRFAAMKDGAYFINVGRGGTAVTLDLVQALQNGKLGGAGLDVTDPEPLPAGHPLWKLDNAIILPHIGGISPYYDERAVALFTDNLKTYLEGKPEQMRNLVDYQAQY